MKQLKHMFGQIQSIRFVVLLGLLCVFPLGYSFGQEPQVTLTPVQYATLQKNLTTLENTIDNQLNTINELEQQLNAAKLSTNESNKQLMEALMLISEQRKQLTEAQNLLKQQEQTLQTQRISLEKAEIYLKQQEEIIKKSQQQNRNSKLLNVILGTALVYTIAKH